MLRVPDKGTERLLDLAAFFDTLDPKLYTQARFSYGDAHCICGWANIRAGYHADDERIGCQVLGITREQGRKLFAGGAGKQHGDWLAPTPKDAARTLRHLAVTGELPDDWRM